MSIGVKGEIEIRECTTLEELTTCVDLQREVFALPEIEISPVRHFVVTKNAGGFVLGAFDGTRLVGFVLSVPAFLRSEKAFYSHMTAVHSDYQGAGIGARLKWAQRRRALADDVKFIKWTFEPVKARNAYFNLDKLGAIVTEYEENFYGIDYSAAADEKIGLASDRLFAEWHLESPKVVALSSGAGFVEEPPPDALIFVMDDWSAMVRSDPKQALTEQLRIREEFVSAFAKGLVGRAFLRSWDDVPPAYMLYKD